MPGETFAYVPKAGTILPRFDALLRFGFEVYDMNVQISQHIEGSFLNIHLPRKFTGV